MKNRLILLTVLSVSVVAATTFAQAPQDPSLTASPLALQGLPGSLHDTMKAMSKLLKQIVSQSSDASRNASSAALADQFADLTLNAKNFTPDTLLSLPADQRGAATAQYNQLLDEVSATGHSMARAFRANDNAKAQQLLLQLDALKKHGHGLFK